jgi:glucokinase
MLLGGDIGGTKTNLALVDFSGEMLVVRLAKSYPSRKFASLHEIIAEFLREVPATVTSAAFGIAGPVVKGKSKLTNLTWEVDAQAVALQLRLERVGLINDLQAIGYGTLRLTEPEKLVLQPGVREEHGAIAVIAAGTGLGEGGLIWDGKRYRAIASEGGHADFAPRNELEIDLLRFLLGHHSRVSYERVVAGPGLVSLYQFLRSRASDPEPGWLTASFAAGDPSAVISETALRGSDPICVQTMELFVSIYGAEAGNLALKLLSTGGVYVAGGIAPKILPLLTGGAFLTSMTTKGRQSDLIKRMPVEVVLNDGVGLLGAAHVALAIERDREF